MKGYEDIKASYIQENIGDIPYSYEMITMSKITMNVQFFDCVQHVYLSEIL